MHQKIYISFYEDLTIHLNMRKTHQSDQWHSRLKNENIHCTVTTHKSSLGHYDSAVLLSALLGSVRNVQLNSAKLITMDIGCWRDMINHFIWKSSSLPIASIKVSGFARRI